MTIIRRGGGGDNGRKREMGGNKEDVRGRVSERVMELGE